MARIHGRSGIAYIAATSAAAATPVAFLSDWSIAFSTEKSDATAMGDLNKVYVAGLPDCTGDLKGFYDDASTNQMFSAATDGLPRAFYLYPNRNSSSSYFWGTIIGDISFEGGVGDAVKVSASWSAAGPIQKQG